MVPLLIHVRQRKKAPEDCTDDHWKAQVGVLQDANTLLREELT
jgi:hypothetical protein